MGVHTTRAVEELVDTSGIRREVIVERDYLEHEVSWTGALDEYLLQTVRMFRTDNGEEVHFRNGNWTTDDGRIVFRRGPRLATGC